MPANFSFVAGVKISTVIFLFALWKDEVLSKRRAGFWPDAEVCMLKKSAARSGAKDRRAGVTRLCGRRVARFLSSIHKRDGIRARRHASKAEIPSAILSSRAPARRLRPPATRRPRQTRVRRPQSLGAGLRWRRHRSHPTSLPSHSAPLRPRISFAIAAGFSPKRFWKSICATFTVDGSGFRPLRFFSFDERSSASAALPRRIEIVPSRAKQAGRPQRPRLALSRNPVRHSL